MNTIHAPNRCAPRAARIAQVKFVALPLDMDDVPAEPENQIPAQAPSLLDAFRTFMIRVIGRLEAARP